MFYSDVNSNWLHKVPMHDNGGCKTIGRFLKEIDDNKIWEKMILK
jgi:hypothetical protein